MAALPTLVPDLLSVEQEHLRLSRSSDRALSIQLQLMERQYFSQLHAFQEQQRSEAIIRQELGGSEETANLTVVELAHRMIEEEEERSADMVSYLVKALYTLFGAVKAG